MMQVRDMGRTKHPWFKAWTNDILADSSLKSLPLAARGFWLYLMCLMHKSPRKGFLVQENGKPYSNEQLASNSGCSAEEAAHLYQMLISFGVFSVSEDGLVFSRRMVREANLSNIRSEAGSKRGKKEFCSAKPQQNDSKHASKPLACEVSVSSLDEKKTNTGGEPPRDGGVGEGSFAEQNVSKIDLSDESLADLWCFHSTAHASRSKRDKVQQMVPMVGELSRFVPREAIRDGILSRDRDRNEWFSVFADRLKKAHAKQAGAKKPGGIFGPDWAKNVGAAP
jgi:hypothetical protein